MNVPPPTPLACVGLAIAFPLLPSAGAWLTARATASRELRALLAPGAGVALWLLAVVAAARVAHGFVAGLILGTAAIALFGAWHAPRWIREERDSAAGIFSVPRLVPALVALAVIAPAVRCYFHDELTIGGHINIVAHLANGVFPPRLDTFPQFELRYHAGFDILTAALVVILRLPTTVAIDVITVLGFLYAFFLGAHLGRAIGDAQHGTLTGLLVLFGGGVHLGCTAPRAPLGHQLIGLCPIEGLWVNPPMGSYFFQHPFDAGIPLFLAVVALHADRRALAWPGRAVLFAVLLGALSQCHSVLFVCALLSFGAAEAFPEGRLDASRARGALAAAAVALAVAALLGGLFSPTPYREGRSLDLHLGATGSLSGSLIWNARSYGLLLPLGMAGLWRARRARLFLALVFAGAVLVPNLVRYRYSWDIVKFATVAEVALALGAGVALTRLLAAPGIDRRLRVAGAGALAAACVAWSATFHAAAWLRVPNTSFEHAPEPLSDADAAIIGALRGLVRPGETVYRVLGKAKAYDQWGGLSTPWPEEMIASFGVAQRYVSARRALLQRQPAEAAAWAREGITWFVLDVGDRRLRAHAEAWVRDGLAEVVQEQGGLEVVHLREEGGR